MSYLWDTAVAAGADLGLVPLTERGRLRDVTAKDAAAIAECEDVETLEALRAGLAASAGSTRRVGVAVVTVLAVAVSVAAAVVAVSEDVEPWVAALLAGVAAVLVVVLAFLAVGGRSGGRSDADAWRYLLDRRLAALDGPADASLSNFSPNASFRGTFAPSLITVLRPGPGGDDTDE